MLLRCYIKRPASSDNVSVKSQVKSLGFYYGFQGWRWYTINSSGKRAGCGFRTSETWNTENTRQLNEVNFPNREGQGMSAARQSCFMCSFLRLNSSVLLGGNSKILRRVADSGFGPNSTGLRKPYCFGCPNHSLASSTFYGRSGENILYSRVLAGGRWRCL